MAITESKNRAAAARIAPRNAIQQSGGATHPGSRGSIERAESKTPGLERELGLEDVLGSGGASGGNSNNGSRRHREADSTDPDVVLEMVVESLDAEDNDDDADAAAAMSSRVSMEVDEELLSLVDDPVPAAPLQQVPQAPARQYAALPPSLRVTKHLTPTVVTVLSPPSFASPGPASPFPSNVAPERGSMPPPATTGKGSAEKKAEGSSATAKGKKGAAQKVRVIPVFWGGQLNFWAFCFCLLLCILFYSLLLSRNNQPNHARKLNRKPKSRWTARILFRLPLLRPRALNSCRRLCRRLSRNLRLQLVLLVRDRRRRCPGEMRWFLKEIAPRW